MLSDDERRSLEEIERSFETEAREGAGPDSPPSARRRRGNGRRVLVGMGGISFALLLAGVGAAALAVFTTTVLCWLFWRVVSQPAEAERIALSLLGGDRGPKGSDPVPREWVKRYIQRLSEAE